MIYYSLYDKSLDLYNPPFVESNNERAKQVVRNLLLTSDDNILQKLIKDIDLVCVGSFDEISGRFYSPEHPEIICHLFDIPIPNPWTSDLSNFFTGGVDSEKLS